MVGGLAVTGWAAFQFVGLKITVFPAFFCIIVWC